MAIGYKQKLDGNFTQVPNDLLNRLDLSCKAKGLLIWMMSKPDNWEYSESRMTKTLMEGRNAIAAGLKELTKVGLLKRIMVFNRTGGSSTVYCMVWEEAELEPLIKYWMEKNDWRSYSVVGEESSAGGTIPGGSVLGPPADQPISKKDLSKTISSNKRKEKRNPRSASDLLKYCKNIDSIRTFEELNFTRSLSNMLEARLDQLNIAVDEYEFMDLRDKFIEQRKDKCMRPEATPQQALEETAQYLSEYGLDDYQYQYNLISIARELLVDDFNIDDNIRLKAVLDALMAINARAGVSDWKAFGKWVLDYLDGDSVKSLKGFLLQHNLVQAFEAQMDKKHLA